MKKVILYLITAMILPLVANATTYTVEGSAAILNGNASWAQSNEDNGMTTEDGVNYILTIKGISVEAGNYQFKIVQDHSWTHNWPSSNYVQTISETAKYNIVYTFNANTKAITCTTSKVGKYGAPDERTYTVVGVTSILGSFWDLTDTSNNMVKGNDGIFRLVKENVALEPALITNTW